MQTSPTLIALLLPLLVAVPASANQSCDTKAYPLSAPDERFADNRDGTVTDKESGLMWMRCSLGQDWDGATCTGKPSTYSWKDAQGAAASINQQGGYARHTDWRMPHIPELAMIVERQCADPRINLTLFPTTPASFYWTASGRKNPGPNADGYLLSFGPEGAGHEPKDDLHFARLVRSEKQ
jgi:hypothetical protein